MPRPAPIPVLFTHYGGQRMRGSERLLLDLMRHFDPAVVRPILWTNGVAMADAARAAGVLTYQSDFAYYLDAASPFPNPLRYAGLVREGLALARRHGVRVIHANSAAPAQWMLPVAWLLRRKLLVHLHVSYLRRSRFVLLLRHADLLVGVSAQVLEGPLADGMPVARTRVIHNGIDFEALAAQPVRDLRAELGLGPETTVLATLGYLMRIKGLDVLFRALARLPPSLPVALLVAGEGPDRAKLEQLAAELGVAGRAHFLGYVADTAAVYRAADIVVQASRNEGFGLVLAEAGAFGLPVVACRVGGVPEVVVDGETGLLVPREDVGALAEALVRLIGDAALRERLGRAGEARCRTLFHVQQMAARFAGLYGELAGTAA